MTRMNEREQRHPEGRPAAAPGSGTPGKPSRRAARSWWAALRRACGEFSENELADRAAALTFFGVLSLFPALLVLVSLFGAAGEAATQKILDNLKGVTPGAGRTLILKAVDAIQSGGATGYALAAAGLLWALWSAFAYVATFVRSSRVVHDLPPGRPGRELVRTRPAVVVALAVMACASALIVVFTGGVAEQAGGVLGIGETVLTVWSFVKWPLLVVLVAVMFAVLRGAGPDPGVRGLRLITPGGALALLLSVPPSVVLGLYVAHLASFNRTYGALASMILFLVWFFVVNVAMLLGLEFDAERVRARRTPAGRRAAGGPHTVGAPAEAYAGQGEAVAPTGGSAAGPSRGQADR